MYSWRPTTIVTYGVAEALYGLGYNYRAIGGWLHIPRNRVASLLYEGRGHRLIDPPPIKVDTTRDVSLPKLQWLQRGRTNA